MEKELTFEKAMKRLEEIVNALESGQVSLDDSLKLFEEGNKIVKDLYLELNNAKGKITILKQELDKFKEEEIGE